MEGGGGGVLVVLIIIGFFVFLLVKKSNKNKPASSNNDQSLESLKRTYGDAEFASYEECVKNGLTAQSGIVLGHKTDKIANGPKRIIYGADRHAVLVAPSRSGKGTTVIIPTLLSYAGSIVCIDPKGQNAAVTLERRKALGNEVICLNPFGLHRAAPWALPMHRFNPLDAINPESDNFVADISALAEALIITEGKDPHWPDAARDFISGVLMHLKTTTGEVASLPRMRELITQPVDALQDLLAAMVLSTHPAVRQRAARFLGNTSDEAQGVLATAMTQTSFLDDPAISACLSGSDFSFADVKARPYSVFLILPSRYLVAYRRWLRLLLVSGLDALMATPKAASGEVLFILDEFASLGHLQTIENAMGVSAGYGIKMWPILQDINQAKALYGDRWETFLANAGVVQFFAANDATTAQYVSDRSGTTWSGHETSNYSKGGSKEGRNWSQSTGMNVQQIPLMRKNDVYGLSQLESIVTVSGMKNIARVGRLSYYKDKQYDGLYSPDPFHIVDVAAAQVEPPPLLVEAEV